MSFSLSTTNKFGCARVASARPAAAKRTVSRVVRSAAASADVPDMGKRNVMNLLLVGAIGLPATSLVGGYAYFFVPPRYARDDARRRARRDAGRDNLSIDDRTFVTQLIPLARVRVMSADRRLIDA